MTGMMLAQLLKKKFEETKKTDITIPANKTLLRP